METPQPHTEAIEDEQPVIPDTDDDPILGIEIREDPHEVWHLRRKNKPVRLFHFRVHSRTSPRRGYAEVPVLGWSGCLSYNFCRLSKRGCSWYDYLLH